jgi:hypothetical protein
VSKILVDNKEKLVKYLTHFHADKDDEQFKEEKGLLVATLTKLEYAPPAPAPAPAAEGACVALRERESVCVCIGGCGCL